MPNRILKDSINESRGLSECSFFAQDLYKRLITYADDYGRFNADVQIMIARLYPRDIDIVTHDDLICALIELCGVNKVAFYTSSPRKEVYGCFPNWGEHQRLRDSKHKCPDPQDTSVNDWYIRRFIPMQMKIEILQRDNFKCQECGKNLNPFSFSAKKLIKQRDGSIHLDHIVPCNQGGRATYENIRTSCAKCNLERKRAFTYDEIIEFSQNGDSSPQLAATCIISPLESNPIQSESNPNLNPKGRFSIPSVEEVTEYCKERNNEIDAQQFIDFYTSKGWKIGDQPMKDWKACIRTWEKRKKEKETGKYEFNTVDPFKQAKHFDRPTENYDHLAVDPFAERQEGEI